MNRNELLALRDRFFHEIMGIALLAPPFGLDDVDARHLHHARVMAHFAVCNQLGTCGDCERMQEMLESVHKAVIAIEHYQGTPADAVSSLETAKDHLYRILSKGGVL